MMYHTRNDFKDEREEQERAVAVSQDCLRTFPSPPPSLLSSSLPSSCEAGRVIAAAQHREEDGNAGDGSGPSWHGAHCIASTQTENLIPNTVTEHILRLSQNASCMSVQAEKTQKYQIKL